MVISEEALPKLAKNVYFNQYDSIKSSLLTKTHFEWRKIGIAAILRLEKERNTLNVNFYVL